MSPFPDSRTCSCFPGRTHPNPPRTIPQTPVAVSTFSTGIVFDYIKPEKDHAHFYKIFFMATSTGRRRPFPALVIVLLLFLLCLYPGQAWMAHFFPRLAGLATIDPGLIILGSPFRLLLSIDLVLVPILFLFLYSVIILINSISQHRSFGRMLLQRVAAVLSGVFFLLVCTAVGSLISYVLVDQLPISTQQKLDTIGINADVHLQFLGYKSNSLHGNILSLLGFLVGLGFFITKVYRNPSPRRSVRLTREQRMTPYQRMLQERRRPASSQYSTPKPSFTANSSSSSIPNFASSAIPDDHVSYIPDHTSTFDRIPVAAATPDYVDQSPTLQRHNYLHCRNQPLQTLEPEAVNYRPLG